MSDVPQGVPVPLDALLAQRDWVRTLARRLVADDDRADEIEQRTWLAAIERPPAHVTSARGWLATTLRNAARKLGRGESRRASHEAASGARGPERPPEELVAAAEMQHLVGRLVLGLDEPYRTTVLLRFFENLEPVEIARRQGVPPETVRTRLRRAIGQLRAKLDRAYGADDGASSHGTGEAWVREGGRRSGGRAEWSAALLAWINSGPVGGPLGETVGETAPTRGEAGPRPTSASPTVPRSAAVSTGLDAAVGGLAMTTAQKLVAAALVLLLLVGGGIAVKSATEVDGDGTSAHVERPGTAPTTAAAPKPPRAARSSNAAAATGASEAPPPPPVDLDRADRDLDLHGVVVLRDGTPVANADVRAVSFPWRRTSFLNHDAYFQGTPGPSTRSATDGTFALRLGRGDVVTLHVAAAGLADATYPDQVAGGRVRVVLTPGVAMRLVAVQADGTPATDVRLEVRASAEGLGSCTREVTTDAQGLATVSGLPPGGKARIETLTVARGSMHWWDVPLPADGEREHRLEFAAFRTLRGRITDAGTAAPIAGARVGMNWTLEHAVTSAPDGSFELPGWTGRSVRGIGVVADGFARADVAVGTRDVVDVALHRGFSVTGRIVAAEGRAPVAGALVGAIASVFEGNEQRTSFGHATADADGRFRIRGLARDLPHVLIVTAPGHARARPDIPAPTPGADVDLGEVVLGAPRAVEGRVLDAEGRPIASASVNLEGPIAADAAPYSANSYGREEGRITDDLGRFRFAGLPAGWFHVTAELPGAPTVEKSVEVRERDALDVVLRSAATRSLVVHVVDEAGKPLPGCRVSATTPSARIEGVGTDASGAATLRVGSGAAQVEVVVLSKDDRAFIQPAPTEVPTGAAEVTVVAREGVWLRARLVDPEGRGIGQGNCRITPAGGAAIARFTDAEGHLRTAVARAPSFTIAFDGVTFPSSGAAGLAGRADGVVPGADEVVIRCERIATGRTLRVRVLTPEGAPAKGVQVFVTGADGATRSMVTGDDGAAPYVGLPAREHFVIANAALGFAHSNTVTVVPDGQTIDVRLRRTNPIRGRVLDAVGSGANARVAAWWSERDVITTATAPDGTFSVPIPEDAAGPFRIVAEGLGTDTVRFKVLEDVAAGATGLEIRLPER